MKVIFAFNGWSDYAIENHMRIAQFGNQIGIDVIPFCLTPNAPNPRYSFKELDKKWRYRYRPLVRIYRELKELTENADVLWIYNGGNFHPEWLNNFPEDLLTIFGCFDDPESSHDLSAPISRYFDACVVGNIASIQQYHGWGCKNVEWGPIFLNFEPPKIREDVFYSQDRPIDLVFFGERESRWRKQRLDYLYNKFPSAHFYGKGWPNGFVNREKLVETYKSAKIGINIHNSTGPINKRLFELPAFGVMQICDNKCRLGQIFNLDNEVIGFDNITEAVDLIQYYLDNDDERKKIAWNGHNRLIHEYSPMELWKRYGRIFKRWNKMKQDGSLQHPPKYERNSINFPAVRSLAFDFVMSTRETIKKVRCSTHNITIHHDYEYFQTTVGKINNAPYFENPEFGPSNMEVKKKRIEEGDFFEWPNMVALNWTVASMVGDARTIIEVGSGTGCFAHEAGADPKRTFLCLEADEGSRNWAIQHRSRPNITYTNVDLKDIDGKFDLLVTIDVIEHIQDFKSFLSECYRISKKAIITTPNRFRDNKSDLSPSYNQHVREWSAGEFYWVLRAFWPRVELYSRPDPYIPLCVPINVNSNMLDLIAVCYDY